VEAARAINDVPIAAAMPKLAEVIKNPAGVLKSVSPAHMEALFSRVLNANFRLGTSEHALALAQFAGRTGFPDGLRVEALKMLGDWTQPSGRDRIVGLWRPLPSRAASEAAEAIRTSLAGIMTGPDQVRAEGARVAAKLGISEVSPLLRAIVLDKNRPASVRVESLLALETLKDTTLLETAALVLKQEEPRLRHQARRLLLRTASLKEAVKDLAAVAENGAVVEKQGAFALLADLKAGESDALLADWLERLLKGNAAPELHLDILEAARRRDTPELKKKLEQYAAGLAPTDPLAPYHTALHGGDADSGKRIFFDKAEVACVRCHKVNGTGGEVGPDLTGIAKREKRAYLLEAIVLPDRQIAKGFDAVVLTLTNGQFKVGIIKSEDKKEVKLMTPEGQLLAIPVSQIEDRARGKSAMPADLLKHLSGRELRDLVEFLATLR